MTLDGAQLDVAPDLPPQLFYCVGGPQALRAAARRADGVILDVFLPPGEVARMVRQIHAGADGHFTGEIGAGLMVSISDNWHDAADRIRPTVARYISRFPELTREMGLSDGLVTQISAKADQGGITEAAALVGDEIVDELAVCGSPARCRKRIEDYRNTGLTLPVLLPEPLSLGRVIADLAPSPE